MEMVEKPGAQMPWADLNQLLATDERFEVQTSDWRGFLLAPKHAAQLAALLYLLCQQKIVFCVQGRGTVARPSSPHALIISARSFSQCVLHEEQGIVEVGAGTSLSHLHQFLFERKQEVALEEGPLSFSKRSVAGLLLSGQTAGIHCRGETIPETILGIEFVTWEGSQIKWGGCQRSPLAGPALHKLIWGLNSLPGVITKIILKTYPLPQSRLRLAWSFRQKEALWKQLQALKSFCSSWEYLGYVLSGSPTDQGFIFAQIAGLQKEMEAFSHLCPAYSTAKQGGERVHLRNFMKQQKLNAYSASSHQQLMPGEYLWHQELDQRTWWITPQSLVRKMDPLPIWKQRFMDCLKNKC